MQPLDAAAGAQDGTRDPGSAGFAAMTLHICARYWRFRRDSIAMPIEIIHRQIFTFMLLNAN